MITNNRKSYLNYLNKLWDQYNNSYHFPINKKPINADYSALTEKIETSSKASKFQINIESELLSVRIFLVKVKLKIGQKNIYYWFFFEN